ncbi:HD domain-containing protein [bacterium]|nr:HD domain-containing protein [bacterium]
MSEPLVGAEKDPPPMEAQLQKETVLNKEVERSISTGEYILARKSQLAYYMEISLHRKVPPDKFVLYKPAGLTLGDMRINNNRHPKDLYIRKSDKLKGIQEAQKGFNKQLEIDVKSGNPVKVKETLVSVVEETLTEPRSGSLEGVSDTVDILVSEYSKESDVIKNLIDMSYTDYSTVLHSINVMAFALGFAANLEYPKTEAKNLGLCALLHDVGKTKINKELLTAPRKLTNEEFEEIKSHTTIGYNVLKKCRFSEKSISLSALDHHEKLDGSGYPAGKARISKAAQIIGVIDCYEAMTNNDRPYRSAMGAFETLNQVIGEEVKKGKYDVEIYQSFVKSLGSMVNN